MNIPVGTGDVFYSESLDTFYRVCAAGILVWMGSIPPQPSFLNRRDIQILANDGKIRRVVEVQ